MSVTFPAHTMPDGTVCRSGPNCRRHGGAQTDGFAADLKKQMDELDAVIASTHSPVSNTSFPVGSKRVGKNTENPAWADELYRLSRAVESSIDEYDYDSLYLYRMNGSRDVNAYLRGGVKSLEKKLVEDYSDSSRKIHPEHLELMREKTAKRIENLDRCFLHEVTFDEPKLLYRGVSIHGDIPEGVTPLQYVKQKYAIGSVVEEKAYSSTSADPDYMTYFGRTRVKKKHGPQMVYEIIAKKGLPIMEETFRDDTRVTNGSIQSFEREVLLNRGSKFRVVGVKNVTFEHSYPKNVHSSGSLVSEVPDKATFPVVQLEQIV